MKNSGIYIVGAVVLLGGGAYLFLKNKQSKDADKVSELDDKLGGTTPTGTTPTGTTPTGITPNITEPVKIDKDVNLDAYNLQQLLEQLKELENRRKKPPRKTNAYGGTTNEWYSWYFSVGRQAEYDKKRQPILDKLAKLGYKFENGLLIKI
jgi:hypothetical protein